MVYSLCRVWHEHFVVFVGVGVGAEVLMVLSFDTLPHAHSTANTDRMQISESLFVWNVVNITSMTIICNSNTDNIHFVCSSDIFPPRFHVPADYVITHTVPMGC
jgi:hypothetical protein